FFHTFYPHHSANSILSTHLRQPPSTALFPYTTLFRSQHVHPRFKCTGCTLDCGVINLIPFIKRIYLIEDFEAPLQVETEIHILHDVLQSKTDYCKKNDGNHE